MKGTIKEQDKTWTIIEVVKWTTSFFEKKGIDSGRLKTELLLCHVLGINRIEIYSNFDKPLTIDELSAYKSIIKRAINHEPIQMIIGKVEFYNLELFVDSRSIVPRPETEDMVDIIIRNNKGNENLNILDIGTGTGCIALTLAKELSESIIRAIDVSEHSLELASSNAEHNAIKNVTFSKIDVSNERIEGRFDIIVSNPPYIEKTEYMKLESEVKLFEPENALTDGGDGLTFYRKFAEIFPEILKKAGYFYLEIGWGQSDDIMKIFIADKYKIEIIKDINNIPRFVKGKLI